jgi:hypothetical protein
VSVVVSGGLFPRGEGAPSCVHHAGHGKFKLFPSRMTASVCRGTDISQLTKSRHWMTMGIRCSLVSEVAGIMTVATRSMLSDMRKGNDG